MCKRTIIGKGTCLITCSFCGKSMLDGELIKHLQSDDCNRDKNGKSEKMNSNLHNSLFAPHQPGHNYPYSRDWYLDYIKCSVVSCIYNRDEKCIIPSMCDIGEDGHCKNFKIDVDGKVR